MILITPVLPSPTQTWAAIAGLLQVATTMDEIGIENGAEANRLVASYLMGFSDELKTQLQEKLRLQDEVDGLRADLNAILGGQGK